MNRPIKFRAFDPVRKQMFYSETPPQIFSFCGGNDGKRNGSWGLRDQDTGELLLGSDFTPSATLMQFTGLRDKNGKEIYEGDILDVIIPTDAPAYKQDYDGARGSVEWDNEGADYNVVWGGECLLGLGFAGASYEVIGNIYENPDLLKP